MNPHSGYPNQQFPPYAGAQQPQTFVLSNQQQPFQPQAVNFNHPSSTTLDDQNQQQHGTFSRKEIAATKNGTFVVSVPVASSILQDVMYTTGEEFTHMKYTAATCEPEEFAGRYELRQRRLNRDIKVAIVITMYNEDENLFIKSLLAVQKNIAYLCSPECPHSWGPEGWKNFLVVIVSDGAKKINPRVKTVLGVMGCYVEGLQRSSVNGQDVQAHIFEFTTQVAVDRNMQVRTRSRDVLPTQILFCLKEKNAKKINSHRWFFQAVCEVVDPEVTMLLDVGTKPTAQSLYHLWRAFERDPRVGGACGEIAAEVGNYCSKLLNPLVASQNFEYKMSNILDKPFESMFGYISVLPGAFSAYRYRALRGEPLDKYFYGETLDKKADASTFTSNLYLAEDRILCFELVTKRNEAWILKYVKSARAETDVPEQLPELISQRRRWLNGSFFAALYALTNFTQIYRSPHSVFQKLLFTIEFLYNAVALAFSWFNLANFFLAFYFLVKQNTQSDCGAVGISSSDKNELFYPYGGLVFEVAFQVYFFALVFILVMSLGNRPQGSKKWYYALSIVFALIMLLMLVMSGWTIRVAANDYYNRPKTLTFFQYFSSTPVFRDMVISFASTYGMYLVASLMHMDPWHILTSMIQYLFLMPTYINIFMIYSFCNLHDVSWGTKGDNNAKKDDAPAKATQNADGTTIFDVHVPTQQHEIDAAWREYYNTLLSYSSGGEVAPASKPDAKTAHEDRCKEYRTNIVLAWIFCNALLVIIFTNRATVQKLFPKDTDSAVNPYLTFLFWSVTVLSVCRFIGSLLYMLQWWKTKVAEAGSRSNVFKSSA